jgi:hypothetical protein
MPLGGRMNKKNMVVVAIAVLSILTSPSVNASTFTNFGFENGLSGWTTVLNGGTIDVVSTHLGSSGTTFNPTEGSYFLRLQAGDAEKAVKVYQLFNATQGEVLSSMAAFDASDYMPYNDRAYVTFYDADGAFLDVAYYVDVNEVGDYGYKQWSKWIWEAPYDGTFRIEYTVKNAFDSDQSSYALFDASTAVPIPAAFWILGSGLLGLVGLRNRIKS